MNLKLVKPSLKYKQDILNLADNDVIDTIKNSFPETEIISCKIPLIFFLLINKSFGFLNTIFFL